MTGFMSDGFKCMKSGSRFIDQAFIDIDHLLFADYRKSTIAIPVLTALLDFKFDWVDFQPTSHFFFESTQNVKTLFGAILLPLSEFKLGK